MNKESNECLSGTRWKLAAGSLWFSSALQILVIETELQGRAVFWLHRVFAVLCCSVQGSRRKQNICHSERISSGNLNHRVVLLKQPFI